MNAHKKTAAKFTAMAFGVIVLTISASTSFAFFYNYFSNLIPPGLLGSSVASLISGIVGTLLFDVASVVWLQTYLNDARTPEQRAISLIMLIVTFLGAAAASVAHLALSATGELALDAATLDSIATISLVAVIIGVIANFGSTIAYQRFSYENKQSVRTSDREDEIQKAEDEAANELDSLVSQKLKERLTHIAPALADRQADRIAAQYERRESAKYGSAEVRPALPSEVYGVFFDTPNGPWSYDVVGNLEQAKQAAMDTRRNYNVSNLKIKDHTGKVVWEGPKSAKPNRPTTAPQQPSQAQTNGHAAGYNYPTNGSGEYRPE